MAVPERSFGETETPIRVFRYPDGGWRKVAADFVAAIAVALVCAAITAGGAFVAMVGPLTMAALFACYVSISYRLRKRRRIRLYRDRIAWDGPHGVRAAHLQEFSLGKKIGWGEQGRAVLFVTPEGKLILPEHMEGFGELARRIEEARYGRIDFSLARSTVQWSGPNVFRYRGFLPSYSACKIAGAAIALVGAAMMGSVIDSSVFFVLAAAFVALAMLDLRQYQNSRIERIGNRLVQFDRWNHPVASVDIATLHHVTSHETGYRAEGRLYGDNGVITFGSNLENPLALVEAAYTVLAGRYRSAPSRTSESLPPVQVRH